MEFLLLKRELQQRVPIARIFAHIDTILNTLTPPEFQTRFIQHIIKTTDPSKFDPSLLKKLSAFLFARFDKYYGAVKYALEDDFVEFFLGDTQSCTGKCDRYYEVAPQEYIHIRSSESMISEGTTGYSLWEASVALLALLNSDNTNLFTGKRVLELGSGAGLGGLAVASLCNPSSVLLTDIDQVHDSYTRPNILLNPSSKIESRVVYWNDLIEEPGSLATQFDTILGCDLVYDPEVCPILFKALKSLLNAHNSAISQVILFCTLRNPQTFHDFVADLQLEQNLLVTIRELEGYDPQSNPIIIQSIESFRIIHINKQ